MEPYCSLILGVCTTCTGEVGAVEVGTLVSMEALVGYYPRCMNTLTLAGNHGGRQCQVGSLTGAVASQRVTEAPKGSFRMVGNHSQSVKAEGSLTVRLTSRAGTKVGLSDPVVPYGRAIAQRIKATPGITGLSPPRVHIDGEVWHLDVGSAHPGAVAGP